MNPIVKKISEQIIDVTQIDPELFSEYNVKRGLRNEDHTGVVIGVTKIGDVVGYEHDRSGNLKPVRGRLTYRGIHIEDIVEGIQSENRLGFEETIFLILTGNLPLKEELVEFSGLLNNMMNLNEKITKHILETRGRDIMNILSRCVLELFTFDENADDVSDENLVKQSLNLIATFPTIIAYAYNALLDNQGQELQVRQPQKGKSMAENFLYMIKGSRNYTELDVKMLDLALVLHADHGGGNNSTFMVRVASSAGTDTYSCISAAIASLRGTLHGGASLQVVDMIENIKEHLKDWTNKKEIDLYLKQILNKEAFDRKGLLYGFGHAIYTVSDPRAVLLKEKAAFLATEKGMMKEFDLYCSIEERATKILKEYKGKKTGKSICANVDFYSGFIYEMLGLPKEIYTPIFAMARIVGWSAHRIEELNFKGKRIVRPAYINACKERQYKPLNER